MFIILKRHANRFIIIKTYVGKFIKNELFNDVTLNIIQKKNNFVKYLWKWHYCLDMERGNIIWLTHIYILLSFSLSTGYFIVHANQGHLKKIENLCLKNNKFFYWSQLGGQIIIHFFKWVLPQHENVRIIVRTINIWAEKCFCLYLDLLFVK